jgi:hypothetical protein
MPANFWMPDDAGIEEIGGASVLEHFSPHDFEGFNRFGVEKIP